MFEVLAAITEILADGTGSGSGGYQYDDCNDYDEDMYANTSAWRSHHPYDYNPYTGGSNAGEDSENGW